MSWMTGEQPNHRRGFTTSKPSLTPTALEDKDELDRWLSVDLEYWCEQLTFDSPDMFRIKLRIPHEVAGGIAALRAGLEALVVEVAKDPEYIRQMDQKKQRLLNLIRHISKPTTAGINLVTNNSR